MKIGGLCFKNKLGNIDTIIDDKLTECLKDSEYSSQKDFIKSRLLNITGDVRIYYNHLNASLVDFYGLEIQSKVPEELEFFSGLSLDQFLIFERHWFDWRAFVVAMIGLAQVIVGALLVCFGMPNFGAALVAEGISDMLYATTAGLSGTFSWQEWAIQKAASISISLLTAGLSKLASIGKQVAKVGSLSRTALFGKTLLKATIDFARQCAIHYLTESGINILQTSVVNDIVQSIEKEILDKLNEKFKNKLISIGKQSRDEKDFQKQTNKMIEELRKCLAPEKRLFADALEKIRFSVMRIVDKEFDAIVNGIGRSGHKHAKNAIRLLKAAYVSHKLLQASQFALSCQELYVALQPILSAPEMKEGEKISVDKRIIDTYLAQLRSLIQTFINKMFTKYLHMAVQSAVGRVLQSVVEAVNQEIDDRIDNHFGKKNPFEVIEQLNSGADKCDAEVIQDHQADDCDDYKQDIKHTTDSKQISNPREAIADVQEMMKEPNRPLGRVDLKMLTDMHRRTTYVQDEHGDLQVIHPMAPGA